MHVPEFKNDEELCQFAVDLYNSGKLKKEVAEILGINPRKLYDKLKAFGFSIYKERSKGLSEEQQVIVVALYESGETIKSISQKTGFTIQDIRNSFKKFNVETKTPKFYREQYTNKDAFMDECSEEYPYFYGWLLSDGCYCNEKLTLSVHPRDIEVLHHLKEYVGTRNNIYVGESKADGRTGKVYRKASFTFQDEDINSRLVALGMEERKSAKEKCPEVFKYNRHFWRGMIEGDGSISTSSNNIYLVGSEEITEAFYSYLKFLFPECCPRRNTKGVLSVVSLCSKKYSKQVLDELYRDCNYKLSRKYNIYMEKYYADES